MAETIAGWWVVFSAIWRMIEGVNWTREAAAAGLGWVRYSTAEIGAEETDGLVENALSLPGQIANSDIVAYEEATPFKWASLIRMVSKKILTKNI